jgi:uncharacterized phage protein gp47/JayE
MATYGMTTAGFSAMDLAAVRSELEAALQAQLGAGISLDADSPEAVIAGILAGMLATVWDSLAEVYDAMNPSNATGVQLDNLATIKGLTRLAATRSTVELQLRGVVGTVVPAGSTVSKGSGGDQYTTNEAVTFTADHHGAGDDGATVDATAVDTGSLQAPASSIDTIVTPVGGWTSVTNDAAAIPGRDIETDSELAIRMALSGQIIGSTTLGSIQARAAEVSWVQYVHVYQNVEDATDGEGRPGHSVEAVVYPAAADATEAQELCQVLFEHVAAGIQTYGSHFQNIEDSQGDTHTIYYEDADEVDVDVNVVIVPSADFPADGLDQAEEAVSSYLSVLTVGDDALQYKVIAAIAPIEGIVSMTVTMRRDADPYAASNVDIGVREKGVPGTISVS